MSKANRRGFLKSSALVTTGGSMFAVPAVGGSEKSANDRIRVAVIGMRRGLAHARSLCALDKAGENVEVVKLCDCDEKTAHWAAGILQKADSVVVLYGTGLMRRLSGAANRDLVLDVADALSAKLLPLLSDANDRGALEIGASFGSDGLTTARFSWRPERATWICST